MKEALRKPKYPHVICECPYEGRGKVDLCFVDHGDQDKDQPYASFELKIVTWDEKRDCKAAREDIGKHLDPLSRIKHAREGHECYNALLLISPEDRSKNEFEEKTRKELGVSISNLVLFTSKAIELNELIGGDKAWKYLRVIVLMGDFVSH